MTQHFNHSVRATARLAHRLGRPCARKAAGALLLAAGALACSEGPTPTPAPAAQGGSAGISAVTTAGGGNVAMAAGASGAGMGGGSAGGAAPSAGGSAGTLAVAGMAGGGGAAGAGGSGGAVDDGWLPLFNGINLDGWTPSPGAAEFFAAGQLAGEPVIHVYPTHPDQSEQPIASLRTNASYSSYIYHVEYKWGVNRFSDRKQTDRDNGICFHLCNDVTKVWPESIEFQIGSQAWPGDWVTGNIFMLVNQTRAQWPFTTMNDKEVFSETGAKKSIGAPASYQKSLAPSQLDKKDDWNILELTVHGSKDAEYKVNGTVVNRVFDMECNEGGTWKPLDHGPIAMQAEFAEVYFRNLRIKLLP